jgi:hypothetical protein
VLLLLVRFTRDDLPCAACSILLTKHSTKQLKLHNLLLLLVQLLKLDSARAAAGIALCILCTNGTNSAPNQSYSHQFCYCYYQIHLFSLLCYSKKYSNASGLHEALCCTSEAALTAAGMLLKDCAAYCCSQTLQVYAAIAVHCFDCCCCC